MHIFIFEIVAALVLFSLNFGAIAVKYVDIQKNKFADTVLYTRSIGTTISKQSGIIPYCFVSDDDRQVFLLARFKDMSKMSVNAKAYTLMCTNVDDHGKSIGTPKESIKGRVYIFASTGYIGIYLYTTNMPFESKLKEIQVCSSSVLGGRGQMNLTDKKALENYDRFGLYINPAGRKAVSADWLNEHTIGDAFDMEAIYEQCISRPEEKELRTDLAASVDKLETTMSMIDEYRGRLSNVYNLEVPPRYDYFIDDKVEVAYDYEYLYETDENGNQVLDENGEPIPLYQYKVGEDGNYILDENGKKIPEEDEHGNPIQLVAVDSDGNPVMNQIHKVFTPGNVSPGGVDFDWYPYSLLKGGYSQAIKDEMDGRSIDEYLTDVQSEWDQNILKEASNERSRDWYKKDGSLFDKTATDPVTQNIVADINAYSTALTDYYTTKHVYEYEQLPALLTIERNLAIMSTVYTDTMWLKEIDEPEYDDAGNPKTDSNGNPITHKASYYVDDGIMYCW